MTDQPADTVQVPRDAFERLVRVAMWVSRGKSAAFIPNPDIAPAYPDATARRALGSLDDAGLLDSFLEPALPPDAEMTLTITHVPDPPELQREIARLRREWPGGPR